VADRFLLGYRNPLPFSFFIVRGGLKQPNDECRLTRLENSLMWSKTAILAASRLRSYTFLPATSFSARERSTQRLSPNTGRSTQNMRQLYLWNVVHRDRRRSFPISSLRLGIGSNDICSLAFRRFGTPLDSGLLVRHIEHGPAGMCLPCIGAAAKLAYLRTLSSLRTNRDITSRFDRDTSPMTVGLPPL
jgi:hypothetical protein